MLEQQLLQMQRAKSSGSISYNGSPIKDDKEEEMTRSALAAFKQKEEDIEKKKIDVRGKVQSQLGRVDEATKRLAEIQGELEALEDPTRKEAGHIRKKIDKLNKVLKQLGQSSQKKEKEYKEALEAFTEKNKEKDQLITKLMKLVSESEKQRLEKLEELSKNIDSVH